jgi:hypothetical protein
LNFLIDTAHTVISAEPLEYQNAINLRALQRIFSCWCIEDLFSPREQYKIDCFSRAGLKLKICGFRYLPSSENRPRRQKMSENTHSAAFKAVIRRGSQSAEKINHSIVRKVFAF